VPSRDDTAVTAARSPHPEGEHEHPAIEAVGLSRVFGRDVVAVEDVGLLVQPGEVFGLVGPDGAGKSTLIRMLATVLAPSGGDAFVFGESVCHRARRIKPRIGYMSQRFSLYPDLTARENLQFFADLRGVRRQDVDGRIQRLLEFADLTPFADRQSQYLSGGMRQKLALAVTLLHEPALLFLDEPTTGVDPVSRREFWRILTSLHRRGITVFVATPYMDEAERCSTVAFMDNGRILFSDSPAGLKRRVPGRLVEAVTGDPRASQAIAQALEGVIASSIFGDLVRVLIADGGPSDGDLRRALEAADVGVTRISSARVDMEAAFAYLAEEARASSTERAEGPAPPEPEGIDEDSVQAEPDTGSEQ